MGALGGTELLILLLLVAVPLALLWRRSKRTGLRGPRKRHIVTRIVCAVLGVGILIAIAAGSWHQAQQYYEASASDLKVRVPTKDAEPLPERGKARAIEIERARLLHYVFVVDTLGNTLRPVHVEEFEIKLPADKKAPFSTGFRVGNISVDYTVQVQELRVRFHQADGPGLLVLHTSRSLRSAGPRGSSSSSGERRVEIGGLALDDDLPRGAYPARSPLSVVPSYKSDLQIMVLTLRAAEDDPLREISASELLASDEVRHPDKPRGSRQTWPWDIPAKSTGFGMALPEQVGAATFLLLAAAILLAQVFRRRNLAFPVVLATIVLYVAALDRVVLAGHLGRIADKDTPTTQRLIGCRQARHTFFFRKAARERLRAVADDSSEPEPLRGLANRSAIELLALTDSSGLAAAVYYATFYPDAGPPGLVDIGQFELDRVAPVLDEMFPFQLSVGAFGEGTSGSWLACRKVTRPDGPMARWEDVCFVRSRNGRLIELVAVPRLHPAFVHDGDLFLYWDSEYGPSMYTRYRATRGQGWRQVSSFRFARVRASQVDAKKWPLLSLDDFAKLVSAPTTGVFVEDGVALWDVERMKKGLTTFQSVIDWR
ncbi:MAG: hypothetical protein ABIF82_00515 [Planctomycetota bacterium]